MARTPRYDEIFERGLEWLDSEAGNPDREIQGEAEFDQSVWDSETRGEKRE